MRKILTLATIAGMYLITSCGPSQKEFQQENAPVLNKTTQINGQIQRKSDSIKAINDTLLENRTVYFEDNKMFSAKPISAYVNYASIDNIMVAGGEELSYLNELFLENGKKYLEVSSGITITLNDTTYNIYTAYKTFKNINEPMNINQIKKDLTSSQSDKVLAIDIFGPWEQISHLKAVSDTNITGKDTIITQTLKDDLIYETQRFAKNPDISKDSTMQNTLNYIYSVCANAIEQKKNGQSYNDVIGLSDSLNKVFEKSKDLTDNKYFRNPDTFLVK